MEFGKGIELLEGKDGYIIACGIMVAYALEAAKQLRAEGFDAGVIDMHTIKPLDTELGSAPRHAQAGSSPLRTPS